jgi:hypothetical protein
MGAGLELFLKKFVPGKKFTMPYADKLSPDQLKMMRPVAYKIPRKIDTFLWSPFHEATSQYYDLGDGVRYAFRLKGGFLVKFGVAKRIKRPNPKELENMLAEMDKRVNENWGSHVKKIMVRYECSRAQDRTIIKRLANFTRKAAHILGWPTVQMELTACDAKEPQNYCGQDKNGIVWTGWEHYAKQSYDQLTSKIKGAETT